MAKATQLAKIDSSIKISNGLEKSVKEDGGGGIQGAKSIMGVEVSEGN